MGQQFVLTDYIAAGMRRAWIKALEDGSFAGRIKDCPGVLAFADSPELCMDELRSTFEDWVLLGLKFGDPLPILDGIDLNKEPLLEPVESL
ncbi:MAG: type II toxin-antitoxin system HicB family antitoxin [Tepidiformaceae bacterium]